MPRRNIIQYVSLVYSAWGQSLFIKTTVYLIGISEITFPGLFVITIIYSNPRLPVVIPDGIQIENL